MHNITEGIQYPFSIIKCAFFLNFKVLDMKNHFAEMSINERKGIQETEETFGINNRSSHC